MVIAAALVLHCSSASFEDADPSASNAAGAAGAAGDESGGSTGDSDGGSGDQLAAGDAGQGGRGEQEPVPAGPDTKAPRVVSFSPRSGATGVKADVPIVVTFSEPMDQESAEAAFHSLQIPEHTFSWDTAGKVLTVTPDAPLPYAEVQSPDAAAKTFTVSVDATATDKAGNALQNKATSTFSTVRRIKQTLITTEVYVAGFSFTTNVYDTTNCFAHAGDESDNDPRGAFWRFDLSALPEDFESDELEKAELSFYVEGRNGNPFTGLGELRVHDIEHVEQYIGAVHLIESRPVLAVIKDANGWQHFDMTAAVKADWDNPEKEHFETAYMLRFETYSDEDNSFDYVEFGCKGNDTELVLSYERP